MLRFIFIGIVIFISISIVPTFSEAHFGGMPILKINGEYVLPDIFDNTFEYADRRDRAPEESYPIGSVIEYEIETKFIPVSEKQLRNATFTWDFGDGTEEEFGIYKLVASHEYTKEGNYLLKISVNIPVEKQTSGSEVIQVVPITIGNPPLPENESVNYLVKEWSADDRATPNDNTFIVMVTIMVMIIVGLYVLVRAKNRDM